MKGISVPAITMFTILILAVSSLQSRQKPAFEVASVKQRVSAPGAFPNGIRYESALQIRGNSVTTSGSVIGLIRAAFRLRDFEIFGAPNWASTEIFDISANTERESASMHEARQMLQQLLADRFQLKVHHEMKELPVYVLLPGKNGQRLTLSARGPCANASRGGQSPGMLFALGMLASCKPNMSMAALAEWISRDADRPVLDRTGIDGGQVFELQWAAGPLSSSGGPSLSTAVQEQLGLRLEATRSVVEVLAIDNVQRPSAN
jgi:uncharacterized protein (TIGR03435 family)